MNRYRKKTNPTGMTAVWICRTVAAILLLLFLFSGVNTVLAIATPPKDEIEEILQPVSTTFDFVACFAFLAALSIVFAIGEMLNILVEKQFRERNST